MGVGWRGNYYVACYRKTMSAKAGLDGILEGLSQCLNADSARRLVEFRVDEQIQARIDQLAPGPAPSPMAPPASERVVGPGLP